MTSRLSIDDLGKTDSKDLIMKFFDPAGTEFENIEMIMQVKCSDLCLFINSYIIRLLQSAL